MAGIPLLPETRAVRTLSLTVMSLMVALGIIALACVMALRHVDRDWRRALADRWTVAVSEKTAERSVTQPDVERIVALLHTIPGIKDAEAIGPLEVNHLLQPWLGDQASLADLPLPALIDVTIDTNRPPSAALVAEKLAAIAPGATLDDHHAWTAQLVRLAETGEALGLGLFAAVIVTAILTVATTARGRLAINRTEIELLHGIGASDSYIVRQFQAGAFWSALGGAIAGTVIAGAVGIVLFKAGDVVAPLIPELRLAAIDWAILAAAPVGAVLLATLVARMTAVALVRRLP